MPTPNESIQLTLNGEPYAMTAGLTAADLVEQLGLGGRRIAVEINEQIVPKS
ncbi:MAG TPA: thiamine biosynthesis protein ThiS, partial [Halomonas sp.]|nr:thiamine biosynthesis protein ThiS [Halomonas sp.]